MNNRNNEIIRDAFVEHHLEELEKAFHVENPEIMKEKYQDKFDDFVMNATTHDLQEMLNRVAGVETILLIKKTLKL